MSSNNKRNQNGSSDANKRQKGASMAGETVRHAGSVTSCIVAGQRFEVVREASMVSRGCDQPGCVRREDSSKFQDWQRGAFAKAKGPKTPPAPACAVLGFTPTLVIANDTARESSHIAIDVCRSSLTGTACALGEDFEIEIGLIRSGIHGSSKQGHCSYMPGTGLGDVITNYHKKQKQNAQNLLRFPSGASSNFDEFKNGLKAAATPEGSSVRATCKFRVDQVTSNDSGRIAQLRITITQKSTGESGVLFCAPVHVLSKLPEETAKDAFVNGDVSVLKHCNGSLAEFAAQIDRLQRLVAIAQNGRRGLARKADEEQEHKTVEQLLTKVKMSRSLVRHLDHMAVQNTTAAHSPVPAPVPVHVQRQVTPEPPDEPEPSTGPFMRLMSSETISSRSVSTLLPLSCGGSGSGDGGDGSGGGPVSPPRQQAAVDVTTELRAESASSDDNDTLPSAFSPALALVQQQQQQQYRPSRLFASNTNTNTNTSTNTKAPELKRSNSLEAFIQTHKRLFA